MLYVKTDNNGTPIGNPLTEKQLRNSLKNTSLPDVLTKADMLYAGYALLPPTAAGPERRMFHAISQEIPVKNAQGELERVFSYTPYRAGELELRWKIAREQRDTLLLESDFTQMQDYPISESVGAAWRGYRKILRDITDQSEDPQMLVWPARP
jgi:hypothetical protein